MGLCHFAVDLLNWEKIYFINSKISHIGVFWPLTCWIGLSCQNFWIWGCVILPLTCWIEKIIFKQLKKKWYRCVFWLLTCWIGLYSIKFLSLELLYTLKISYIGDFHALTCWIGPSWVKFPNVAVCHFPVDLLNWEKFFFTNSKISYIGVFPSLTCWIGPSWLKFPNVGLCHFAVDLLNWENHFHANQKKLI